MSIADTLGDYTLREKLYERKGTAEYRAVRAGDQLPVLLKVLDPRWCGPRDVERLKNEFELERALDVRAAIRALALEVHDGRPVLVTEDFAGDSLDRRREPMPLGRFLPLAVRMAAAVEEIHARGLIHRDLRPENFVVGSKGEVRITNFGIASRLPREEMALRSSAQLIEGSLPYMSPEQTGRMNRPVDSRSDLYSLGVTFYQMLTGHLPFVAEDLVGWVHSHIARTPAPANVVPPLAEAVWRIVLKLLAKVPEDRYQSAAGLRQDLERCRGEWATRGRIEPFALGLRDWSDHLVVPHKLYGREAETALLLSTFERTAATGVPELLVVHGPPGIGKSSLTQALQEPIMQRRGFFARGKFERHKRDIPYLAKPARDLILGILAESPERIGEWADLAQRSLGNNGQAVVDIVPELELLIGPQPPLRPLPPHEAENRVKFAFRSLIGVFATREHPLTVLLDDLQWADGASLRMLQHIISHPETRYLLVIGAYRDSEVSDSHPLMRAIEQARNAGVCVTDLPIQPLSVASTAQLVAEALRCRPQDAADLGALVDVKTGGNPFFAIQFLIELERRDLLALDRSTGHWRWDAPRIAAQGLTDNVGQLMVEKLKRMPPATQEVLRLCACIGDVVDASLLAEVGGRSKEETDAALWPALEEELLLGSEGTFRFSHDRVQEAAYALVPERELAALHLRIGRVLLSSTPPEKIEENVFTIVNQLDRGVTGIESRDERDRLAELNILAGNRAKSSGGYASGVQYFSTGSALLGNEGWQRRHDLVFALELGLAECQYLSGNRAEAERRLSELGRRAKDDVEASAAAFVKIDLHMTESQPEKAVETGIEFLRRVGIDLAAPPPGEQMTREYERTWQSIGERRIEDLVDLPMMTDPVWRGVMEVLQAMETPALTTDLNLYCLIPCHMVQISVRHGNTDASCYAYEAMGALVGPILGDYATGIRLGQLGYELVEKRNLRGYRAFVDLTFASAIGIWKDHVSAVIGLHGRAFEEAVEDGDLNSAFYAIVERINARIFAGSPLDEIQSETEKGLDFARRTGFDLAAGVIVIQQRLALSLQGKTEALSSFHSVDFDEELFEAHLARAGRNSAIAVCFYFARKLQACAMASDWGDALRAASKAREVLWTSMVLLVRTEVIFYGALALAACHDGASPAEKVEYRKALTEHQQQLGVWAESCPENFGDRHALVSAEIARIDGQAHEASDLYEEAIRLAKKNGFVHGEGLAYERASLFHRARAHPLIADAYLREARACYLRWGAHGKVREIDRLHPWLLPEAAPAPTSVYSMGAEQLDLLSVLRASQATSREIDQETLLRTLLRAVLEHGGARTARLVLVRDDTLTLEGEATSDCADGEEVHTRLLGSAQVTASSPLPASVLHYVRRTKERVVIEDARADAGKFAGDDYFGLAKTRSLLCQPVLRQDQAIALLVLENDLVPGAFTVGRLVALELLATQAAISFENARLLEERRRAETEARFVAEASKALAASLDYEGTLGLVARLAVPRFADWCAVDVVEGGRLHRITVAHSEPAKERLVWKLRGRIHDVGSNAPAARALAAGTTYILADATDEQLLAHSVDATHAAMVRELGTRSVMAVPLFARDHPVGVITFCSARPLYYYPGSVALAEEVARHAATAIDNARLYKEAQDSIRARDVFLSLASHELRTPVTSLVLTAQRLRGEKLASAPESIRSGVVLFDRQVDRLKTLIDDMMTVGQIMVGHLELHPTRMDLAALVRDEVKRFAASFEGAKCVVALRADRSVHGCWDADKLAQVVKKLLANAVKFGAGAPVEITAEELAGKARLVVVDHGIGIEPEALPNIFGRFERAVSPGFYGGLGIGLYIVQQIVHALGGTVRAESTPNVETSFTVELPTTL